jgi:predicted transcriptional regulator
VGVTVGELSKFDIAVPVYLNRKLHRQLERLAKATNRKKTQVLRDGLASMIMEAEAAGIIRGTKFSKGGGN